MSNTLHDILLMVLDTHTDARMHGQTGQNHYAYGHITVGGGIKILTSQNYWDRNQAACQGADCSGLDMLNVKTIQTGSSDVC